MTITQNLMKEEIEKVTEKFGKKNKVNKCVSLKTISTRRTVTNRIILFKIYKKTVLMVLRQLLVKNKPLLKFLLGSFNLNYS